VYILEDYNTLQNTATRCNTLLHTQLKSLVSCRELLGTATHCNTIQNNATHTATHTATQCSTLQHTQVNSPQVKGLKFLQDFKGTVAHCNSLQHTATHCNTHCNTLQHTQVKFLVSHKDLGGIIDDLATTWGEQVCALQNDAACYSGVCVAVCCSVLQCVVVCCFVCCSALRCVVQCDAVCRRGHC